MSAAETAPDDAPGADDEHTPVDTVIEVVDEATSGPPPPWSRSLTSHLAGFDEAVDARFDRHLRGRAPVDRVMYSVTELADFSLLWHLLAAARGLRSDADLTAAVRVSAALAAESTLVNAGIKSLFRRERPIPDFERPHHLRIPLTTSFPSGHASAAFCAATLLADGRGRAATVGWFGLAGLVASSRVHVKIHHASDVLGGVAVGLVVGQVARRLWRLR
ncbi:phosphatase PAP2 family protein [Iamia sp. SCSIO 61187]|uniref:phosphatase PAP2 family protein n=1 Tax=Iamia sp. SCSIO 61187 TaxID=2722752 RepID=UPI001C62BF06|nr:phosphatase PAP2 family protein [Iamia sp. SCSIO 61187]QYG93856.1 phosphatase PAP2 family protein [Iamia sp. SCSIO 61187]